MLSTENGLLKNDFSKTILRQKPFYKTCSSIPHGSERIN